MGRSDELATILSQHTLWLASGREDGKRADLSGARLDNIDFAGADLSGAILRGASLAQANLSGTQLLHADLRDASLTGANLSGANLLLADFSSADLREADLSSSQAPKEEAQLGQNRRGPRFKDADLRAANLRNAYCYISDFSGANLAGAVLEEANLERANLSENDLTGIACARARLGSADLRNSNLTGADFRGADMVHANLQSAILSDADVSGAAMQSTNLADARVDGIRYDRKALFRGIRVANCYGSTRFARYAQDQDYIEEFRDEHPYYHALWLVLTDCGRSMGRVILWSAGLAFAFGLLYFALGEQAFAIAQKDSLAWSPFTMIYYSVVTFTTLGFGDITPRTPLAAGLVMIEVVIGYLMLGILISILATKVARRS